MRRRAWARPSFVTERFWSEPYDPDRPDVSGFSCGEEVLDVWLREQAAAASRRGTARNWVWVDDEARVVGYYALAPHKIARGRFPLVSGGVVPSRSPAVLLARLALSEHLRDRGPDAVLVADALERGVVATQTVAARVVVVDALAEPVAGSMRRSGSSASPAVFVSCRRYRTSRLRSLSIDGHPDRTRRDGVCRGRVLWHTLYRSASSYVEAPASESSIKSFTTDLWRAFCWGSGRSSSSRVESRAATKEIGQFRGLPRFFGKWQGSSFPTVPGGGQPALNALMGWTNP